MRFFTQDFLATYNIIEQAAHRLVLPAAKKQLDERAYSRCTWSSTNGPLHDFAMRNINEDGVTMCAEYNDACNCHPEYTTATVYIPWADIEHEIKGHLM